MPSILETFQTPDWILHLGTVSTLDLRVLLLLILLAVWNVVFHLYKRIVLPLFNYTKARYYLNQGYKQYKGSCHCGMISFECRAPRHLEVWDCNCSICMMKQNKHFVVPKSEFQLSEGSERFLSTYKFNTNVAQHHFCSVCGICAFYVPRSNPDGIGITYYCISSDQVESVQFHQFDGVRWEDFITNSGIQKHSKKSD